MKYTIELRYVVDNIFKYIANREGQDTIESTIETFYKVGENKLLIEEIIEHLELTDIKLMKKEDPMLFYKILSIGEYYKIDKVYIEILNR